MADLLEEREQHHHARHHRVQHHSRLWRHRRKAKGRVAPSMHQPLHPALLQPLQDRRGVRAMGGVAVLELRAHRRTNRLVLIHLGQRRRDHLVERARERVAAFQQQQHRRAPHAAGGKARAIQVGTGNPWRKMKGLDLMNRQLQQHRHQQHQHKGREGGVEVREHHHLLPCQLQMRVAMVLILHKVTTIGTNE